MAYTGSQWQESLAALGNTTISNNILNGKGFCATTGKLTSLGTQVNGLSLYNPVGSGKTFYVYSARLNTAGNAFHLLYQHSDNLDPALGTPATIVNRYAGSAVASVASCTYANAPVASVGSLIDCQQLVANAVFDFIAVETDLIVLPPGSGIEALVNTATNNWFVTVKWLEV